MWDRDKNVIRPIFVGKANLVKKRCPPCIFWTSLAAPTWAQVGFLWSIDYLLPISAENLCEPRCSPLTRVFQTCTALKQRRRSQIILDWNFNVWYSKVCHFLSSRLVIIIFRPYLWNGRKGNHPLNPVRFFNVYPPVVRAEYPVRTFVTLIFFITKL